MKNLTNKQKVIAISILVVLFCIGFSLGIFTGIERKNREYKENNINNEIEENEEFPEPIEIKEAINNGWFVIDTKNTKIYNKDILDRFIENTNMNAKNRVADKITIAAYNMSDEPIIYDLEYKIFEETYINEKQEEVNKTGYVLKIDPSRVFSYETEMSYQEQIEAHKMKIIDDIPGSFYGITLTNEPEYNVSILSLSLYAQIQYLSDTQPYEEIEITRFAMDSEIINNTEENVNNKVTTIDIESFFDVDRSVQQKFTLNQEEIYEIFDIIDNLKFSKETCDGLPSFYIKYNSKEKDGFITYGLETFNNKYHITSAEKGEAVLTQEQRDRLDKIINKYFKFLTMQVQE